MESEEAVAVSSGGLGGSSVARSLSRALDKYYEVPLETEEWIPVDRSTKEGVPPSHNRSWRTLDCPDEVEFINAATQAAYGAGHGGVAHIIRSANSEEQAVAELEAAGLRDRLQYMLPCMLVSPLAASIPTACAVMDHPNPAAGSTKAALPGEPEALEATATWGGPLGEAVEDELPELGFSFDHAMADDSYVDPTAVMEMSYTALEATTAGRADTFDDAPEASEEPEIRGSSRTPPVEETRSYFVPNTESAAADDSARLVQSAVEPRRGAGMGMGAESLEDIQTLLLADLNQSLRAGTMSTEIQELAANVAGPVSGSEMESVSNTAHSRMTASVAGEMASPGTAYRYHGAEEETLDGSALLWHLDASFEHDHYDDDAEDEALTSRHRAAYSSFKTWSLGVSGGGGEDDEASPFWRNEQQVARSVSLAFLRWCAAAADPLPGRDATAAEHCTTAMGGVGYQEEKEGERDGGGGDGFEARVSVAFRNWLESGAASEASPEVATAWPPQEAGEFVARSVSLAFQKWCASTASKGSGAQEATWATAVDPQQRLSADGERQTSVSEDMKAPLLAQEAAQPSYGATATDNGYGGVDSTRNVASRRHVSATFREWCRSIDYASSVENTYRSASGLRHASIPSSSWQARQQSVRSSMPAASGDMPPLSADSSRHSALALGAIIAAAPVPLLGPETGPGLDAGESSGPSIPTAMASKDTVMRAILLDPVLTVMQDATGDVPLGREEVRNLREYMVMEITALTGRVLPDAVKQQLIAMPPCVCIVSSPTHRMTRCQMRIADSPMPGLGVGGGKSLRSYFYTLPHGHLSPYSCCQVDGSEVLCGAGPNGGHTGVPLKAIATANVARLIEFSHSPKSLCHKRKEVAVAVRLHGNEINSSADGELAYSRDREIAAFLTELLEMQVRCVVASGFTCAHNACNPKTLIDLQQPHFDPVKILPLSYIRARGVHPSYKKGCGRDFFNYFGSSNGDDGIRWKPTTDPEDGLPARVARIGGLVVTSTLLERDEACAVPGTPYRVGVYRLRVSWAVGHCCWRRNVTATMKVVHIQSWDQSPAQLTRRQVGMLYNAVSGNPPGDTGLGFQKGPSVGRVMVHCAAGIGRTGNIAYGLAELLCHNIPKSPLEKLMWLRRSRPEAIQTPEQLVDGIQLSGMLLQEVLLRMERVRAQGRDNWSAGGPANAV